MYLVDKKIRVITRMIGLKMQNFKIAKSRFKS
jgi:hypothetical protein